MHSYSIHTITSHTDSLTRPLSPGNKKPHEAINPAKQAGGKDSYCGERQALRHLFVGPAQTLKDL